jgi:hypothetical protein
MGKRKIRWDRDPDILARLEGVAQMMIRGGKAWQIADAFDVSLRTANRDIRRVRILWKRESEQSIEKSRQESLAKLRALQQQALTEYDKVARQTFKDRDGKEIKGAKTRGALQWLKFARECEQDIVALEGTRAPDKIAPTDPSGEKEYGSDSLTREQRIAEICALLDRARERADKAASQGSGGDNVP